MTGIINMLKTLPASAEGDVAEMRPREKYFLLPEEAQNAIWDEKWPASKVMFYWSVRGVMDIFATTSTEPWPLTAAMTSDSPARTSGTEL